MSNQTSSAEAQGPESQPPVIKKPKKKFPMKAIIIPAVILVVIGGGLVVLNQIGKNAATATNLREHTVATGDVSLSISGTAAIQPREQYTISALVSGEILSDDFEEGQAVSKDDLLYVVDAKSMDSSIKRSELSVERAQMAYDKEMENAGNMTIRADSGGLVTQVYAKDGDTVPNGFRLADVVDNSRMSLTVPFLTEDTKYIRSGMSAAVTLLNSNTELTGTVARVYTGKRTTKEGAVVTDVEITLSNVGALQNSESATAVVAGTYACNSAGSLVYAGEYSIKAEANGDLYGFGLKAGDQVRKGQTIATLTNDNTSNSIRNAQMSLEDAELALQNLKDQLDDYNITSPISGTVIEKTIKVGDKLDSVTSKANMAVIADMSELVFTLRVDELDISKIKVGQKATVTADAVEGKTFDATVENISIIGQTANGVTSYNVKMVVKDFEGLWPGMNINSEIVVDSAKDVLLIPVNAVNRGNLVLRKTNGQPRADAVVIEASEESQSSSSQFSAMAGGGNRQMGLKPAPEGYEYVRVTLGLNDASMVEVKSGLVAGDVVTVTLNTQDSFSQMQQMQQSGGPEIQGGGPSGGGQRTERAE